MPDSTSPSIEQLQRAIAIAEQIQQLESELASLLGGQPQAPAAAPSSRGPKRRGPKRTMSAEARARISEAQRARWAKAKEKR